MQTLLWLTLISCGVSTWGKHVPDAVDSAVDSAEVASPELTLTSEKEASPEIPSNGVEKEVIPDPCAALGCKEGEECLIDAEGEARCDCLKFCPLEEDIRNFVCTNSNATFNSECEFHRQECLCGKEDVGCNDKSVLDMHLDYYGTCTDIRNCEEIEMKDFPRRMKEWLRSVMESLDIRQELPVYYSDLHRKFRHSKNPHLVPALWEFCNMDDTHDRIITRSELFPLIAPLKALEHCITPFLDNCDVDSNGEITLSEWGHALNLEDDEIEDICEDVEKANKIKQ